LVAGWVARSPGHAPSRATPPHGVNPYRRRSAPPPADGRNGATTYGSIASILKNGLDKVYAGTQPTTVASDAVNLFTAADGSPILAFTGLRDRWRDRSIVPISDWVLRGLQGGRRVAR
jgi:hypothetical protein